MDSTRPRLNREKPVPSLPTIYRGREGMWMWLVQRVTGIAVFFFLLIHILDTSLVRISPQDYEDVIGSYHTPLYGIVEAGLVAAIVLHAFNGIRIILVDRSTWALRHQRMLTWIVWGIFVVLMVGFLPRHLASVFGGGA